MHMMRMDDFIVRVSSCYLYYKHKPNRKSATILIVKSDIVVFKDAMASYRITFSLNEYFISISST